MESSLANAFVDELEKIAQVSPKRPWGSDPGPYATLATYLDQVAIRSGTYTKNDGFTVSDLREHLKDKKARKGKGWWIFKGRGLDDTERYLDNNPNRQQEYVRWSYGK